MWQLIYEITSENSKTNKISDNEVFNIYLVRMGNKNNKAKTIKSFKYDKHNFNAMMKNITKYDDCKDFKMLIYLIAAWKAQHKD